MASAGSSAEAAFRLASETVPAASVLAERADTVSSTPNVTTIDAANSPASSRFSARTRLVAVLETEVLSGRLAFTEGGLPEGDALRAALGEIVEVVLRNLAHQALLTASSS